MSTVNDTPVDYEALLRGLISLGQYEDENGEYKTTLEYDNYQDVAMVKDGNGKIIGECLALPEDCDDPEAGVFDQFVKAIQQAIENTKEEEASNG